MRKIIAGIIFVLLITTNAFAGRMATTTINNSSYESPFAVGSAQTVYTRSFPIKSGEYFGLSYKATSTIGAPNIAIELEQSYELPTTEGSSDTEWVVPDNLSPVVTGVTTETQHHISFSPVPLPYARFKVTEQTRSTTDTQVTLKVTVIEKE